MQMKIFTFLLISFTLTIAQPCRCGWGSTGCRYENGLKKCLCDRACTLEFNPRCGTDGQTYPNPCSLEIATCESQGEITEAHPGECQRVTCASILCIVGSNCIDFPNGTSACVCNDACPDNWDPRCGSDGVTYGNECEMNRASCTSEGRITEEHEGECPVTCDLVDCRSPRICQVENGEAKCVCPEICPAIADPRCGTDGRTYGNACELSIATCTSDGAITEAHRGQCRTGESCTTVRCGWGECQVINGHAQCVCNEACPRIFRPVCGTDNVTYSNDCVLAVKTCQTQGQVQLAHTGECQPTDPQACIPSAWRDNVSDWPYPRGASYEQTFDVSLSGNPSLQYLITRNGNSQQTRFLRESVAALLNAGKNWDYQYTEDEVKRLVKQSIHQYSKESDTLTLFRNANRRGRCPL